MNDKGRDDARALGQALQAGLSADRQVVFQPAFFAPSIPPVLSGGKELQVMLDGVGGWHGCVAEREQLVDGGAARLGRAAPEPGTHMLIVTHKPNILDAFGRDWFEIKEGEASIFKPAGDGNVHAGRSGPDQPVGDVEVAERWSGGSSARRTCGSACSASAAPRSASRRPAPRRSPACSTSALDAGLNVIDTAECYLAARS